MLENISNSIESIFFPILNPFFKPINGIFNIFPPIFWKLSAVGLFLCTILWVLLLLKKEYVNLDAPSKSPFYDLRIWTIISMLPHMIIYWIWGS